MDKTTNKEDGEYKMLLLGVCILMYLTFLYPSTGDLLYGLGKVRSSQGLLDQSFAYYFRAVAQYRSTIGDMHAATARAAYKLAEHYMRLRDLENARYVRLHSLPLMYDPACFSTVDGFLVCCSS